MTLEDFYPTVILALGPPPIWPADRTGNRDEYISAFVDFGMKADVYGDNDIGRYPLSKAEREDRYRRLYADFQWWYSGRSAKERNW